MSEQFELWNDESFAEDVESGQKIPLKIRLAMYTDGVLVFEGRDGDNEFSLPVSEQSMRRLAEVATDLVWVWDFLKRT